jgi:hypothetical protein
VGLFKGDMQADFSDRLYVLIVDVLGTLLHGENVDWPDEYSPLLYKYWMKCKYIGLGQGDFLKHAADKLKVTPELLMVSFEIVMGRMFWFCIHRSRSKLNAGWRVTSSISSC